MRVIIVGAGVVGTALARYLAENQNDVCLIESDEERARHVSNRLDCMVIHDEGNSLAALEKAEIAKADTLICVTGSDEINIIVCGIAAARYPNLLKIARVRNESYVRLINPKSKNEQGIFGVDHVVHPNVAAANTALAAIEHDAAGDVIAFAGSNYELGSIEIQPQSQLDGLNLKDYRNIVTGETLVTLLERGDECILPSGATSLAAGDRVHILASEDEMDKLFELGGRKEGSLRSIGIVGGGQVGSLIADGLLFRDEKDTSKIKSFFSFFKGFILKSTRKVIIIEQDYTICKELAARFPEAVVLNEDISDEAFVLEEQLNGLDLIVTATGNQELNIITALYLKSAGVRRAIAMVASDGYAAIARRLGIDIVVPLKSVVVESILGQLLGKGVHPIRRLGDGSLGIFEIEILPDAPISDSPITEFKFAQGGLVMLVKRGDTSFIPRGDYIFKAGDRVVIIVKKGNEKEIEKSFNIQLSTDTKPR